MSQVNNTLPTQGTQHIISAMESVIDGLRRSANQYMITVAYTGVGTKTGRVFTQSHLVKKKEVSKVELCANYCVVTFKPSLQKRVLFLPYDAVEEISHFNMVKIKLTYLYRAEQHEGHASRR